MNHENVKKLVHQLLIEIGEDPTREGLIKTPKRVARAWDYITQGYTQDIKDVVNGAIFHEHAEGMVIVRDIEFYSMCEHHLLPFFGVAHIGYIPDKKLLGLSKLPRVVDVFARRLQLQERLTQQVADTLFELLEPRGLGVVIEARHMCMQMRGVEKARSLTTTSAVLGEFRDEAETRAEFLNMISKTV
ncbi:MAG: GTP cyclohydrolase I FolE [Candidatus Neomarinimicrobiota bacterium]|jgi:GTP cyclohydrolase I